MSDLNECAVCHARAMLADVYLHGGSILFKRLAVVQGLVHDVTPDKWYSLTKDMEGDYCFLDNAGECNYAGSVGSRVYQADPQLTLTCPF